MIWSKARFQHSIELFPRVFREVLPLLLPLSGLLWGLEIYMSYLNKERFANPYDSSMLLLISAGLGAVVLESFISVIWIIFVAKSTQRQMKNGVGESSSQFLFKNFHQVLIEYLRSMISTALYALLFLIPGLIRWVHLTFTCYVASFDPDYKEGKKDALKASRLLVKGNFFKILFLLIFIIFPPFAIEEMVKSLNAGIITSLLLYFIAWMLSLYFAIYLALTFFAVHSYKLRNA